MGVAEGGRVGIRTEDWCYGWGNDAERDRTAPNELLSYSCVCVLTAQGYEEGILGLLQRDALKITVERCNYLN